MTEDLASKYMAVDRKSFNGTIMTEVVKRKENPRDDRDHWITQSGGNHVGSGKWRPATPEEIAYFEERMEFNKKCHMFHAAKDLFRAGLGPDPRASSSSQTSVSESTDRMSPASDQERLFQ
jgi:hypothetical protein